MHLYIRVYGYIISLKNCASSNISVQLNQVVFVCCLSLSKTVWVENFPDKIHEPSASFAILRFYWQKN